MKITIQDAIDTDCTDSYNFLVQESTTKQESVVKNKGDAQCLKVKARIERSNSWVPFSVVNHGDIFLNDRSETYMKIWVGGVSKALDLSTGKWFEFEGKWIVNKLPKQHMMVKIPFGDTIPFSDLKNGDSFLYDDVFCMKTANDQCVKLNNGVATVFANHYLRVIRIEKIDFENNPYKCCFGDLNAGDTFLIPGNCEICIKTDVPSLGLFVYCNAQVTLKYSDVVTRVDTKVVEDCC